MNFKKLGSSDMEISEIGFGCMSLGSNHKENEHLIHHAIDHGINFFDTADLYQKGFNEESVGKALRNRREQVVLCSKAGNVWNPDGVSWHWDASKKHILQAVDASLARLQTDYLDLYLLHGGTLDDPIDESIEAFEHLKKEGKIKHYGISSIRPNVIREYIKRSGIVSVMMQYSLLDRRPEEAMLELLKSNKVGVLARGSLAKGLLAGKPATEYLDYNQDDIKSIQDCLEQTTKSSEHLADIALQFVLSNPAISSAVIGIRTMEQLDQILSFRPDISDKAMNTVRSKLPPNRYNQHL